MKAREVMQSLNMRFSTQLYRLTKQYPHLKRGRDDYDDDLVRLLRERRKHVISAREAMARYRLTYRELWYLSIKHKHLRLWRDAYDADALAEVCQYREQMSRDVITTREAMRVLNLRTRQRFHQIMKQYPHARISRNRFSLSVILEILAKRQQRHYSGNGSRDEDSITSHAEV